MILWASVSRRQFMVAAALLTWPEACDAKQFGNKAANLAMAAKAGLAVPPGVALAHALTEWQELAKPLLTRMRPPFAVRSSSSIEDSAGRAFAGVFETVLGVTTMGEMAEAIE